MRIACSIRLRAVTPVFRYWKERRKRTKVEIVSGDIRRLAFSRQRSLCNLQSRLNHPCDTNCDLILKLEHVLQ
jgi:hypothetical protein